MSPFPGSPTRPLWKNALYRALFTAFRSPRKGAPLHRASIERDDSFPESPFNFPVERSPMILNSAPVEKDARLQSLVKSLVDKPPTDSPAGPPRRLISVPWAFLLQGPSKGSLLPVSLHRAPIETLHLQGLYQPYLTVLVRSHSRLPS